mmetsp:Transcript_7207/g.44849  ORF Transcript_7207/g.44849 Transcript_7207/m.44849 type:complete len:91 (-) Transcript_7207:748-1020(-)
MQFRKESTDVHADISVGVLLQTHRSTGHHFWVYQFDRCICSARAVHDSNASKPVGRMDTGVLVGFQFLWDIALYFHASMYELGQSTWERR